MLSCNARALVSVREGVLGAGARLNLSSVPRVTRNAAVITKSDCCNSAVILRPKTNYSQMFCICCRLMEIFCSILHSAPAKNIQLL